ncbi:ABC transporter ATP-binding protein [Robiginitomaculum antarcticum]|uniref:ABC transporter ATP-binding protein n=1 Tax=Robiginitomaculum antarcticum TaxID=437507 RepID=UPI00037CF7CC|nr:ABC transporter ATP-binding protein [Robiginitomaculum antarcticum]
MIKIENASFRYPVFQKNIRPDVGMSEIGGTIIKEKNRYYVEALKDLNITLKNGSRVGLIGLNGSGKTTLLKVCAGILPLTSGKITVQGDISTLFASTIFSNPHLTGVDNIKLLGAICGLRRRDVKIIIEDVTEFSELGAFMDMPVRTYSAGMRSRLGFGFATSLKRDVLLIDEVIGAGDLSFYQKARDKVTDMLDTASTIIIASHSVSVIKTFCTTVLWMRNGHIEAYGDVDKITADYVKYVKKRGAEKRSAIKGQIK